MEFCQMLFITCNLGSTKNESKNKKHTSPTFFVPSEFLHPNFEVGWDFGRILPWKSITKLPSLPHKKVHVQDVSRNSGRVSHMVFLQCFSRMINTWLSQFQIPVTLGFEGLVWAFSFTCTRLQTDLEKNFPGMTDIFALVKIQKVDGIPMDFGVYPRKNGRIFFNYKQDSPNVWGFERFYYNCRLHLNNQIVETFFWGLPFQVFLWFWVTFLDHPMGIFVSKKNNSTFFPQLYRPLYRTIQGTWSIRRTGIDSQQCRIDLMHNGQVKSLGRPFWSNRCSLDTQGVRHHSHHMALMPNTCEPTMDQRTKERNNLHGPEKRHVLKKHTFRRIPLKTKNHHHHHHHHQRQWK